MRILVEGFFTLNQDIPAFKEHLRDFLVQIKVIFIFIICLRAIVLCLKAFRVQILEPIEDERLKT